MLNKYDTLIATWRYKVKQIERQHTLDLPSHEREILKAQIIGTCADELQKTNKQKDYDVY